MRKSSCERWPHEYSPHCPHVTPKRVKHSCTVPKTEQFSKIFFYERPVNSSYAMCSIIFIGPNLFISTHSSFLFTPQSGFLRHPLLLRGVTCYCHPHVTPSPMYWRRTGGTRLRQIYHGLLPRVSVVVLSCDVHARDV